MGGQLATGKNKSSYIPDNYKTLQEVTAALRKTGLESSNLIVGVDFSKSNQWTGELSFGGRCLHAISSLPNPYEQAISIIARTLSSFDDDNLIPCFGFGDASTNDQHVFSFLPDHGPCKGLEGALKRYKEIVPNIKLAGPTSFAPIIETAIDIVVESGCQYHVLLIIADGQVTGSSDINRGRLSPQEQCTINAIVTASEYPLSIVLVGVGDGPWDMMRQFDDRIPRRKFDNFQFVNFTAIMSRRTSSEEKEAAFALAALMEIPIQYKAALTLGLLNRRTTRRGSPPLPPPSPTPTPTPLPHHGNETSVEPWNFPRIPSLRNDNGTYTPPQPQSDIRVVNRPDTPNPAFVSNGSSSSSQSCPVCWTLPLELAFNCGHQTCVTCGNVLRECPICRAVITSRIRLY